MMSMHCTRVYLIGCGDSGPRAAGLRVACRPRSGDYRASSDSVVRKLPDYRLQCTYGSENVCGPASANEESAFRARASSAFSNTPKAWRRQKRRTLSLLKLLLLITIV